MPVCKPQDGARAGRHNVLAFVQTLHVTNTNNTMTRTFFSYTALLLSVSFIMGCGGQPLPEGMPRLYPASIEVTQEGTPLEGATVTLVSEDSELGRWSPTGITNASGVAVLQTNGLYRGAPLGTFKVVITKRVTEPHPHPELAGAERGTPEEARYDQLNRARQTFNYVESQYSSIEDTPLTIEIVAGQRTYSIDAGKKVQETVVRANQ